MSGAQDPLSWAAVGERTAEYWLVIAVTEVAVRLLLPIASFTEGLPAPPQLTRHCVIMGSDN